MKKHHRKIIRIQAARFKKLAKGVESLSADSITGYPAYSKEQRHDIRSSRDNYYIEQISDRVKYLSVNKSAKILRAVYYREREIYTPVKYLCATYYSTKKVICDLLW